ncbi:PREDICTED: uncharacterized protein LOC105457093, partial [Wasmannia auropunctata]|uniref:uncharacterized protein LOC105457093 n=1 Tax=Wasmannia auropunctata TaxID=64793 RepID=UPI0005EDBC57
ETTSVPLKSYELTTLTYGTRPASFIAVRCLHQLAEDEKNEFPLAAKVVVENFYMDDLLIGAETIDEVMEIKKQVTELLKKGGFELHKWNSNIGRLKKDTAEGPVITLAKILMQNLWSWRVGWDDSVPVSIQNSWSMIRSQLSTLELIDINRLMIDTNEVDQIDLHGFSDASEQAYRACIYIRCRNLKGNYHMALVCSKSRVAPLKALSLPRLELSGALLLIRLMNKVVASLGVKVQRKHYWTDSQIVLVWDRITSQKVAYICR